MILDIVFTIHDTLSNICCVLDLVLEVYHTQLTFNIYCV